MRLFENRLVYYRTDILSSIKILDLTRIFTGPFASQILADLGAEVIKIEPPSGDDTRYWGPPFIHKESRISGYFAELNRNKKSIVLNLKSKNDYDTLIDLVKECDIVMENFSPGVAEQLGVDFQVLNEVNPDIVYLSITGFGPGGPYRDHPSYDIIAQAESGIMSITGTENGEYVKVGVPIGDIAAGLYGVIGVLSALLKRTIDGKGRKVETDLFSSLTSWLKYNSMNALFSTEKQPQPMGTSHPNIVPYQSFLCGDNRSIVVSVGNNKIWSQFIQMIEDITGESNSQLRLNKFATNEDRIQYRDELIPELQKIFLNYPATKWIKYMRRHDIPAGNINKIEQVQNHVQLGFTNQFKEISKDNRSIKVFMTPLSFSDDNQVDQIFPPSYNNE